MTTSERDQHELALARKAAQAFCAAFDFPAEKISELDGPPILGPLPLTREGRPVMAYRWLGGGRGDYYVQVEVSQDQSQAIVVYGGYSHQEFGAWVFNGADRDQPEKKPGND